MARVLVTGGAGFIGSRYVARAVRRGDEVVVLDDLSRAGSETRLRLLTAELDASSCARPAFTFIAGSVADADVVRRACAGCDRVVHLAGQVAVTDAMRDPRADFEANVLGTINVLEALRVDQPEAVLLHASTNKVYGDLAHLPIEETPTRYRFATRPQGIDESEPLQPRTPYGCSNAAADQYVRDYASIYGLRAIVFRQSCIFGPGQMGSEEQGWVAWLLRAALRGEAVTIFGDGRQVRDLLYVDDLLDAYDAAAADADTVAGRAYNVGGGMARSVSVWCEFAELLAQTAGRAPEIRRAPWRPADQRIYVSDTAALARDLGWAPRTTLEDGLAALRDWLLARESAPCSPHG